LQWPTKARNGTRWRAQKTLTQLKLTNCLLRFNFCRRDFGSRKTSPKVRAGHVPFGADDCLLPLMQAIIILMACLQQVSRVLALVSDLD
jgi:hypothetical protein